MGKTKTLKRLEKDPQELGSGNHAKCYVHPTSKKKVILVTDCPIRARMAEGHFADSRFFPQGVKLIGKFDGKPAYEMEKYTCVDKDLLSEKDKRVYNEVMHMCNADDLDVPKKVAKAIGQTLAMLKGSCERIQYDACSHNMMMTSKNKLVLNDIFWTSNYEGSSSPSAHPSDGDSDDSISL